MPSSESRYASEGTLAHELCAILLRYALGKITLEERKSLASKLRDDKQWADEMLEHAQSYVNYIMDNVNLLISDFFEVELTKMPLSPYVPKAFGTADFVALAQDTLEVVDFKYGVGVPVSAHDNTQLKLYAIGALNVLAVERPTLALDIQSIKLSIVQPRLSEPSTYTLTKEELIDWAKNYVQPRAELAFQGKGDYAPSAQTCKFCRAKPICKGLAKDVFASVKDTPSVDTLTIDEAGDMLKKAEAIRNWLSSLEEYVKSALLKGSTVRGWKMVEGRSNRKIVDEILAARRLANAGYGQDLTHKMSLLGITALEKLVGKKELPDILGDVLVKPEGPPTMVVDTDPRPTWSATDVVLAELSKVTL